MDCLVEPMCQTRAGDSGSWFNVAPNETKALATALAIRPPIGMIAPSPAPLTPVAVGPRVSRPTCHFLTLTSDLGACIFYRGSPVDPGMAGISASSLLLRVSAMVRSLIPLRTPPDR